MRRKPGRRVSKHQAESQRRQIQDAAQRLGGVYAAALSPAWRPDPAAWSDEALRAETDQLRALCSMNE